MSPSELSSLGRGTEQGAEMKERGEEQEGMGEKGGQQLQRIWVRVSSHFHIFFILIFGSV